LRLDWWSSPPIRTNQSHSLTGLGPVRN